MFETLESRRLMSVVVDVRRPGGARQVTITDAGQKVNLEVWATVTGEDGNNTNESLQIVAGSLLSSNISGGAALGKLSVSLVAPFNATGSSKGTGADLDDDGDLDVGSNNDASQTGFVFARAQGQQKTGTLVSEGMAFHIANVTFTVQTLLTGARTDIVFRPRTTSGFLAVVDGQASGSVFGGTFSAGSGVQLTRPGFGVITGRIFNDTNSNGLSDSTETNVTGFNVFLDEDFDGVRDSNELQVATHSSGNYSFNNVKGGVYRVTLADRDGWRLTAPTRGYHNVTLNYAQISKGYVFAVSQSVLIQGRAFNDTDGDKVWDVSESALVGWIVYLDRNKNGILDTGDNTAKTDGRGNFSFFGMGANSYHLRIVAQPGFQVTQPTGGLHSFTLGAGDTIGGRYFGARPIA
jgi:hypothetical protein